jgi:hypothetical protein
MNFSKELRRKAVFTLIKPLVMIASNGSHVWHPPIWVRSKLATTALLSPCDEAFPPRSCRLIPLLDVLISVRSSCPSDQVTERGFAATLSQSRLQLEATRAGLRFPSAHNIIPTVAVIQRLRHMPTFYPKE